MPGSCLHTTKEGYKQARAMPSSSDQLEAQEIICLCPIGVFLSQDALFPKAEGIPSLTDCPPRNGDELRRARY